MKISRGIAVILLLLHARAAQAQFVMPKDLDGDALIDTVEDANGNGAVDAGETDPFNADTDRGGEADGSEVHGGRDPLKKEDDFTYDQDGDGLTNGKELSLGTDPKKIDTDGDGFIDGADPFPLEKAYAQDANKNGLPDEWEVQHNLPSQKKEPAALDPAKTDSDEDGVSDAEEFKRKTNPTVKDTDRDGVEDGEEVKKGTDPALAACLESNDSAAQFPDMQGHWSASNVLALRRTLILPERTPLVEGYGVGAAARFQPDRPVSRFEFLKLALLSSCIALRTDAPESLPFSDVAARGTSADLQFRARVIGTAVMLNIIQGYPDGTFRPDSAVTRAEAVKILIATGRFTDADAVRDARSFPDVPGVEWFSMPVTLASRLGFIDGYADGRFRPASPITRAESAKIIRLGMLANPRINADIIK